ncbi:unnamed protein product [Spirodela intermedia]|uniref:Uncharacterized protein n=1 Tax=Spirodela intermedia TaxID=51605 RepID=A0A7I8JSU5_SPIIN|nr:unnamed protein product [Spirodela intermedia]CAA6673199.1 unnamed protein product [Spirodela intermedia]
MCFFGGFRPMGWLLGLPFAFMSLVISAIGIVIWTVGMAISTVCPCFMCVTVLVELALELIKVPLSVMEWFISLIPC